MSPTVDELIARIKQILSEQIGHINRLRVRVQQHRGQLLAMGRHPAPVPGMTAVRRNPAVGAATSAFPRFRQLHPLSSRHGGQVAWRAVPDPIRTSVKAG